MPSDRLLGQQAPQLRVVTVYRRQVFERRKVTPETKVEKPGIVPASEMVDSEITNPQDQNRATSKDPLTEPSPGRLPARASRS
jgi:hypothetical protein